MAHNGIKEKTYHNQKECRHGQMKAAYPALRQCQTACIGNECVHRSHSVVYTLF